MVWTDGSCPQNGAEGCGAGLGVYWNVDHPLNMAEPVRGGKNTNNVGEYQAAIAAIETARSQGMERLKIHTDSRLVMDAAQKSARKWEQSGWTRKSGTTPSNLPEIVELTEQIKKAKSEGMEIEWRWVKGHAGEFGNEMADKLANEGARIKKSEIENRKTSEADPRADNSRDPKGDTVNMDSTSGAGNSRDHGGNKMVPKLAITMLEEARVLQAEKEAEIEEIINLLIKDSVYRVEMRDRIKMVDTATQVTYCPQALHRDVKKIIKEAGKSSETMEKEALLEIISDHKVTIAKLSELLKGREIKEHKLRQVIDVLELSLLKGDKWDENTRTNYIQVTPEQLGSIHQENKLLREQMEKMQTMMEQIMDHRVIPNTIQPAHLDDGTIREEISRVEREETRDCDLNKGAKQPHDPS